MENINQLRIEEIQYKLKNNPTEAELRVIEFLKEHDIKYKFQEIIGIYIVDFLIKDRGLIIEVDGEVHKNSVQRDKDKKRDSFFRRCGLKVLRIWNSEAEKLTMSDIEGFPHRNQKKVQKMLKDANYSPRKLYIEEITNISQINKTAINGLKSSRLIKKT